MFKLVMTTREFVVYLREGIYSLRFAVLLLSLIILLFVIVQICEIIYSFLRFQQDMENDEYGPTEIVVKDSDALGRRSRKASRKRKRDKNAKPSKEAIVQLSLTSDESTQSNRKKEDFDEKSLKVLKSSSFSTSLSAKSASSQKLPEKLSQEEKHFANLDAPLDLNTPGPQARTKDSSGTVQLSSDKIAKQNKANVTIKSDEAKTGKEKSLTTILDSAITEAETQMVSGSTLSSRYALLTVVRNYHATVAAVLGFLNSLREHRGDISLRLDT